MHITYKVAYLGVHMSAEGDANPDLTPANPDLTTAR